MKRALKGILVLTAALVVALAIRVAYVRASARGPAGGTGVIEGVDVNVTSRIATRIAKVNVREGDFVKRGDILVELDCAEAEATLAEAVARLAAAEAGSQASRSSSTSAIRNAAAARAGIAAADSQLAALEAQEKLARIDLERAESLQGQGAATVAAVDDARTRHDTLIGQVAAQRAAAGIARDQAGASASAGSAAGAQATAAQRNIEVARAAVARAKIVARECTLTAPRNGMVALRILEPGEAVQPGSVILTVTDVTEARTRFYLPNADLAAGAPGRKVDVMADAYPGQIFSGTISYVSPRAEFTPRNVQTRKGRERLVYAVEVRIPNADMRLRSGMPVEVTIRGSGR